MWPICCWRLPLEASDGISLASSTLLHELNSGNLGAAALEFLKWDSAAPKKTPA